MSFQWSGQHAQAVLLEWHDLRAEPGAGRELAQLVATRLAPAALAAGIADMGLFLPDAHSDRVLILRGFADRATRVSAYSRFFASDSWTEARSAFTGMVRRHAVNLSRAIRPEAGLPAQPHGTLLLLRSDLRDAEALGEFHLWQRLFLRKAGLDPIAAYATLAAINDVPAVPVVRNATAHFALMREAGAALPVMPQDLLAALRFPPEWLRLERLPARVA